MANYVPTKCVFRSCKKEFFEQWQKDKDLIDDNLYEYLLNTSEDLFQEYRIEDSCFTDETDCKLPPVSNITTYENYTEAELWYSGGWYPAPEVAFCLAEILAQKAGINTEDVQILFTVNFAENSKYVLTTDSAFKDKLLISLFCFYNSLFDDIAINFRKDNNFNEYWIKDFYDLNHFFEPSEMLSKIKKIIKDNNLQGYENLGKDYEYTSTQIEYLDRFLDLELSDDLRSLLDFQSRYNSDKQNITLDQEISFNFLIYCDKLPTEDYDFYLEKSCKFAGNEFYFELGKRLYCGDGCTQDKAKAEELFKQYAIDGNSMYNIGYFYSDQDDFDKSFKCYKRCFEEHSDIYAAYKLGIQYYLGRGCTQDKTKAEECFAVAVNDGWDADDFIWDIVNVYYENEDYEKSIKYLELFINSNSCYGDDLGNAQFLTGLFYTKESVVQDFTKAIEYFKLALKNGIVSSALELGKIYYEGKGVKQDKKQAEKWFAYTISDDFESEDDYALLEDYDYFGYFDEIPELYYKNGELKKACEWYEKFVNNDVYELEQIISNLEDEGKSDFSLELCKLFAAKGDEYAKEKLEELEKKK